MKKVSLGLLVAALLLTACSNMDMDELLEESVQSSKLEVERPAVMCGKQNVLSVCFMDYEEPGIVAKLQLEDGHDEWEYRQVLSDEDKQGMAEAAYRTLQRVPKGVRHTMTCARLRRSICVYRAGFFTGEKTRYRVIVVSEQIEK